MNTQNFIPTAEKVEVLDYPYGFSLRTTLYDTMEFNPSKGYRHVTQTINPKTNRINNPKKSTYYDFLLRYKNEDGHIKTKSIDFNKSFKEFNEVAEKVAEVWEYLSDEEKEYCIRTYKYNFRVAGIANIQYRGTHKEAVIPELQKMTDYFNSFAIIEEKKIKGKLTKVIVGYNITEKIFLNVPEIDKEALEKATPENYNPFKLSEPIRIV